MTNLFYKKGFTMVELIVVMGITVVLAGVGTSSYFNFQHQQAVDGASVALLGTVRDAQQRAMSQENSSAWGVYINAVNGANDYYELFYGDSHATGTVWSRTTLTSDVKFSIPAQGQTLEINFAKSTGLPGDNYTLKILSSANSSIYKAVTMNSTTGLVTSASRITTIGDSYQGGIVAYILQPSDPGYVIGVIHGLIAAPSDQIKSWCPGEFYGQVVGTSAIIIGTGNANTNAIVSAVGAGDYGAKVCQDLTLDSYSDWYMPSEDELGALMGSVSIIGLLPDNGSSQTGRYFSSSECFDGNGSEQYAARSYYLNSNSAAAQFCDDKISQYGAGSVRCVRSF